MTKTEVIKRLCALAARVGTEAFDDAYTHDCFCGDSRMSPEHFFFEEPVLKWIEDAVLQRLRGAVSFTIPYKLYVWRKQPLYVVMAHATCVARALESLLLKKVKVAVVHPRLFVSKLTRPYAPPLQRYTIVK